jgi:hypothetical protein
MGLLPANRHATEHLGVAVFAQPRDQVFRGERTTQQVALDLVATERAQMVGLIQRLYALGDDLEVQAVPQCNNGRGDGCVFVVGGDLRKQSRNRVRFGDPVKLS